MDYFGRGQKFLLIIDFDKLRMNVVPSEIITKITEKEIFKKKTIFIDMIIIKRRQERKEKAI